MTTILTTTSKGQLTLKRDLLQHLGVSPGEQLEFEKLPNGEVRIRAARPCGNIEAIVGLLAGKTDKVATLEDMQEAIEGGWAGEDDEDHR